MKKITITLLLLAPIAMFAQVVNLEDDGANVQNSTSGTGYFQWENTKLDEGILYADSAEIEEELVVRDSTIIEMIEAHSSDVENLEDTDEVTLGGIPVSLPGSIQNSSGAEGGFLWNEIFLFASGGYGQIANYNANGFSIVNGGEGPFIIGSNGGDININSGPSSILLNTYNPLEIGGVVGGTEREIKATGGGTDIDLILTSKGIGTVQTSSAHTSNISSDNDIITKGYADANYGGGGGDITYNTYTPTFSDQVNIASNTLINAYYLRSGNFVQVYVMNEWEASTNGPISFDISLPLATEINDSSELIGNGCIRIAANSATNSIQIFGNVDDDEATFKCYGNASISFVTTSSFSYIIQETEMMSPSSRFSDFNSSIENKSNSTDVEENDLSIPDFGKRDIEPDVPGLQFINKLEPVSYEADYNLLNNSVIQQSESLEDFRRFGLVSSDVERVIRENGYNFNITENKQSEIIRYEELVMPLIKSVQELNALVESQKEDINSLKELVNGFPINLKNNPMKGSGSNIEQNVPNPFDYETEINMYVNHSFHKAEINIYDLKGSFIKSVPISGRGNTSVKLSSFDLDAGIYLYSLIADEQVVETKRMIINK